MGKFGKFSQMEDPPLFGNLSFTKPPVPSSYVGSKRKWISKEFCQVLWVWVGARFPKMADSANRPNFQNCPTDQCSTSWIAHPTFERISSVRCQSEQGGGEDFLGATAAWHERGRRPEACHFSQGSAEPQKRLHLCKN